MHGNDDAAPAVRSLVCMYEGIKSLSLFSLVVHQIIISDSVGPVPFRIAMAMGNGNGAYGISQQGACGTSQLGKEEGGEVR